MRENKTLYPLPSIPYNTCMEYRALFFDLDDTLYPSGNGLWEAIQTRMNAYITERLEIPLEKTAALRKQYYLTYGTTLRGLQRHHNVDPEDYLAFVHDLPLGEYIQADPSLRELIERLPQDKWIFTNSDAAHAGRVLDALGVSGCFKGIVDICALDYHCKPEPAAYQRALQIAGNLDPNSCMFFDDSLRNLRPARDLGIFTVLVGKQEQDPAACLSIRSLFELPVSLEELFF
jgi:putative hydrolase of the HAD superfamily